MSFENPSEGQLLSIALNYLLSNRSTKTFNFHEQCNKVRYMLNSDTSGMVDSLTDLAVDCVSMAQYKVVTENEELNNILKDWMNKLNISYLGKIGKGISGLAEEYAKERFKASSLIAIKILDWEEFGQSKLELPTKIYIIPGENIHCEVDKQKKGLDRFTYYLGKPNKDKTNKLDNGIILTKPFARPFDKYPVPFLYKRGIHRNWVLLDKLKNKQGELISQLVPYLLQMTKGTETLARENKYTYKEEEFREIAEDVKKMFKEVKNAVDKIPFRGTSFDEVWKHLVPDIGNMFKKEIPATIEKNILAGLGFIDIEEAVSTSRRESILNPKVFISDVEKGVKDFATIIEYILFLAVDINSNNTKYNKHLRKATVSTYPVKQFITDKIRTQLRTMWKDGKLSEETYCELVGNVSFETELRLREKEARDGTEAILYPHISENTEKDVSFLETKHQEKLTDKKGDLIPEEKLDEELKDQYNLSTAKLRTAPYKKNTDLPPGVKNNMTSELQSIFRRVFNDAYGRYHNDTRAFRVAWSVIRRIARKNDKGKWVRKRTPAKSMEETISDIVAITQDEMDKEDERLSIDLKNKQLRTLDRMNKESKDE